MEEKFKNQQTADMLHLSVRQVKSLKAKVRNGPSAFSSQSSRRKHFTFPLPRHEQRIFTNGYTFSFGGKKYIVPDKTFPAFPGDVLTVVSGKDCQIQVIYKDQLYDVEEFVRVLPEKGKSMMTYEELSIKRSELGRMGRRASPFG